jgi:hypothetical protein
VHAAILRRPAHNASAACFAIDNETPLESSAFAPVFRNFP